LYLQQDGVSPAIPIRYLSQLKEVEIRKQLMRIIDGDAFFPLKVVAKKDEVHFLEKSDER